MNTLQGSRSKPASQNPVAKRVAQVFLLVLAQVVALFLPAGRLDWVMAWVYLGMYALFILALWLAVARRNPGVIAERAEIREGTKGWDLIVGRFFGILAMAILVVAGLDVRYGWSGPVAAGLQAVTVGLFSLGYAAFGWAMASNPFFSQVVRIQRERGHSTVSGGPYRYVRHPGYAGQVLAMVCLPWLLGSVWALIPAGMTVITLLVRTALEDRTLQAELSGYAAYTERVRYRLLPGIW